MAGPDKEEKQLDFQINETSERKEMEQSLLINTEKNRKMLYSNVTV
jgi:hypothetical protein